MSEFDESIQIFSDWSSYLNHFPIETKRNLEEIVDRAKNKRVKEQKDELIPLLEYVMENGANPEFSMAEHSRLFDYLDPKDYGMLIQRDRSLIVALEISARNWLDKNGFENVNNNILSHFHLLSPYYQAMFSFANLETKVSILLFFEKHLSPEALNLLLEEENPRAVIVVMSRLANPLKRLRVLYPDARKCVMTMYEHYESNIVSKIHIFIVSNSVYPQALQLIKAEFARLGGIFGAEMNEEREEGRDLAGGETDDESLENSDVLRILSIDGNPGAVTLKITPLEESNVFLKEAVTLLTSNRPRDELYSDVVRFHSLGPKIRLEEELVKGIRNESIDFADFCADAFSVYVEGEGMTEDVIFDAQESLEKFDLFLRFPSSDDIVEYE